MSIDLSSQKNSVCVAMKENSGSEAGAHAQTFLSVLSSGWRLYFRKCMLISYEAVPEIKLYIMKLVDSSVVNI